MAAPPAVALVQNLVKNQKRKIIAIYKNSDAIRVRAICQN